MGSNVAYFNGGGVQMEASSLAVIESSFSSNSANKGMGGGIYAWNSPSNTVLLQNATFTNNSAKRKYKRLFLIPSNYF